MMTKLPTAFISDFGPLPGVVEDAYTRAVEELGRSFLRPRAVLAVSGHWPARETLKVSSSPAPATIHDYSGFPEEFYKVRYPCPGDPVLAARVVELLKKGGFSAEADPERGLDHGVWTPVSRLYPDAKTPVVELTVPDGWPPAQIMDVGRALAPLRSEGVLLLGCGALIHNLSRVRFNAKTPDSWAVEFATWLLPRLKDHDAAALAAYAAAPRADLAVPTPEHFDPLFYVLGAAEKNVKPRFFHEGMQHGSGLMLAFTL